MDRNVTRNTGRGFVVLALLLAAACGDDGTVPGDDGSAPTTPGTSGSRPDAALDIDAGSDELPDARRASVRVTDGGVEVTGYIDDADAVSALLAATDAAVDRLVGGPATDVACTEQYGGPDVAHVTGTIDGRPVDTRFHRADGCGIADWDLVQPILPAPVWSASPDAAIGDAANPVMLSVGDRFTIRLPSNATTGFSWGIELPPGLTVADDRYEEPTDTDLVGAGGTQVFVIEAAEAGSGVIELAYRQDFDEESEPVETRTFHVEVTADS